MTTTYTTIVPHSAVIVLCNFATAQTSGSHRPKAQKVIHHMTKCVSPAPFSAPDTMTSVASNTCHAAISKKSQKPRA